MEYKDSKTLVYYFWIFILLHTLLWTIGPALLRPTLPHDTLESITWGLQGQWGYNKHPFLTAWLCAGISRIFGDTSWSVYFLAQLSIAITFITLWRLAEHMLSKTHALVAALALEGVFFYNINSFNITPDTLQSPLWALLCLFFYRALRSDHSGFSAASLDPADKRRDVGVNRIGERAQIHQNLVNWFLVGFLAALCFCTKYQAFILFATLFLFCLINPQSRQSFKKFGIYFALILFMVLISPHLLWLYQHQFITFFYAKGISTEYTLDKNLLSYFTNPLRFFINSLLNVSGLFILLWPFYFCKKKGFRRSQTDNSSLEEIRSSIPSSALGAPSPHVWGEGKKEVILCEDSFDRQFVLFISLGPFLLTLICCALTGDYFPPRWATPYFFSLSLLLMIYLKPNLGSIMDATNKQRVVEGERNYQQTLDKRKIKQFLITLTLFSTLLFSIRISSFILFLRPESDAFLPNRAIALFINNLWDKKYHTPLPFLAGSHYLVAGVLPYLPNNTVPYLSWDVEDSSWVNEQQIHKQGGIFIWDVGGYYTWDKQSKIHRQLPNSIKKRFPELQILPNYVFPRLSDKHPVIIGVAILPPDQALSTGFFYLRK